jgi:hypothetical protein
MKKPKMTPNVHETIAKACKPERMTATQGKAASTKRRPKGTAGGKSVANAMAEGVKKNKSQHRRKRNIGRS